MFSNKILFKLRKKCFKTECYNYTNR